MTVNKMLNPNCSELAVNFGITEPEDMLDAMGLLGEKIGGGWVLAGQWNNFLESSIYIPIDPKKIHSLVKVVKHKDDDGEETDSLDFSIDRKGLIKSIAKTKKEEKELLKCTNMKDCGWDGIVFAKGIAIDKPTTLKGKDKIFDITYVNVYPQDSYGSQDGMVIQFNQHCQTHKFPPLAKAHRLLGGDVYAIDGGGTGEYEEWKKYWFNEETGEIKTKTERFCDALSENIDEYYKEVKPVL